MGEAAEAVEGVITKAKATTNSNGAIIRITTKRHRNLNHHGVIIRSNPLSNRVKFQDPYGTIIPQKMFSNHPLQIRDEGKLYQVHNHPRKHINGVI